MDTNPRSTAYYFGILFGRALAIGIPLLALASLAVIWFFTPHGESVLDSQLWLPIAWVGAAGAGIVAIHCYPLALLFRRVTAKTQSLAATAAGSGPDPKLIDQEPVNEVEDRLWFELESSLNRIRWDLRKKTDRLHREREELRALMNAATDPIAAIDSRGRVQFFNSPFAVRFGERALTDSDSRPRLEEILRDPDVLAPAKAALETGLPQRFSGWIRGLSDQTPRYYSVSYAPFFNSTRTAVEGAVLLLHDISELKRAEQIRIEFVENASHELRTPLTSIKGFTQSLKTEIEKSESTPAAVQFVGILQRNVERLIDLVNDILDLSTIERSSGIRRVPVSTREVTDLVLQQLEPARAAKGHTITSEFETDSVWGDPQRIAQILLNLVDNAIKYLPQGGGRIRIRWRLEAAGAVSLSVMDNGPGIPAEHLTRLFERFYRMDRSRSPLTGGTGLGLAIVKHLMILHGGGVEALSPCEEAVAGAGAGVEFRCTFDNRESARVS